MESQSKRIELYLKADGKSPFTKWSGSLDRKVQAKLDQAQDKMCLGLLTDSNSRSLKGGLFEFKINFGAGYRIYFGQMDSTVVLLLGGDKSTQDKDILKAKEYWADYERRENANDQ